MDVELGEAGEDVLRRFLGLPVQCLDLCELSAQDRRRHGAVVRVGARGGERKAVDHRRPPRAETPTLPRPQRPAPRHPPRTPPEFLHPTGTISSHSIAHDGSLTLLASLAGSTGSGSAPIDMALSRDSHYLYALDS